MPAQLAVAINMVGPLIARRMTLPEIIAALSGYAEATVIEAYDHVRMNQFDRNRCGDAFANTA